MYLNQRSSTKIAESLLQIQAIKLQPEKPFTWASGWKSPIYCDNRKVLSYPNVRTFVRDSFVETIKETFSEVDIIVGVATGGIAHGVLVADFLDLPFAYVRSSSKGHGMKNLIEGKIESNQKVVVIEDLISTGGSGLKAVDALKDANCNVLGMVAIFTYGFELARTKFLEKECKLITLSDYETLLDISSRSGYINENHLKSLSEWRKNPEKWTPSTAPTI